MYNRNKNFKAEMPADFEGMVSERLKKMSCSTYAINFLYSAT